MGVSLVEIDFPFPLLDGSTLIVSADCTQDDTVITAIACPDGALDSARVLDASLHFSKIEIRAREEYDERMAKVVADRKDGVA